jgi:hypothetical protein
MKTNINLLKGFNRGLKVALASAPLLLAGGLTALGQVQQDPTTVAWWDCVVSGPRDGLAYISFTRNPDASGNNFTFTGYEVMVPKAHTSGTNTVVDARNDGGDSTRTGSDPVPEPLNGQQIFGSQDISGPWNFDTQGRVVGFFYEISTPSCNTNVVTVSVTNIPSTNAATPMTNAPDSNNIFYAIFPINDTNSLFSGTNQLITYSNSISCTALTNAISFMAKVVPGKRLTLTSSTSFGKVIFRGVPAVDLADISGAYGGSKKQARVTYGEFFSLTPSLRFADIPNVYAVMGSGPTYSYMGHAILSSQRKVAFSFSILDLKGNPVSPEAVRAATGSFNYHKVSFTSHGWDQPAGDFVDPITFQGALQVP